MKIIKKKYIFYFLAVFFFSLTITTKCNAAIVPTEYSELNGKWFYIKNAYTGYYLDVAGGTAQGGTNIQQYEYNGSSAQKWFFEYQGNGEYLILTDVGSTISNNTKYLNYALDIDCGTNANGTQIHLWNVNAGDTQRVGFTRTDDSTYVIWTKCSNFNRVASLADNLCVNGINVHQWEYFGETTNQWILEPVWTDVRYGNWICNVQLE